MASHCFRMCLLIENGVNNRDPHPEATHTHTHTSIPAPSPLNKHTHPPGFELLRSECQETMRTQQNLIIFNKRSRVIIPYCTLFRSSLYYPGHFIFHKPLYTSELMVYLALCLQPATKTLRLWWIFHTFGREQKPGLVCFGPAGWGELEWEISNNVSQTEVDAVLFTLAASKVLYDSKLNEPD